MAKNQAFRGIKLLYIFLTVTPTDSACFAWGVDLTQRLEILVGFLSGLLNDLLNIGCMNQKGANMILIVVKTNHVWAGWL